jgi:hypothetical protein
VTAAVLLSEAHDGDPFPVFRDRIDTMGRRALLRFILTGQGTDGERSRAAFRLVMDFGCTMSRHHRLVDKGRWAARPVDGMGF